jgi:hypothetical protein
MDFELAEEERAFVAEVERFLAEHFSQDVMDESRASRAGRARP